jgi:hypothetical protein
MRDCANPVERTEPFKWTELLRWDKDVRSVVEYIDYRIILAMYRSGCEYPPTSYVTEQGPRFRRSMEWLANSEDRQGGVISEETASMDVDHLAHRDREALADAQENSAAWAWMELLDAVGLEPHQYDALVAAAKTVDINSDTLCGDLRKAVDDPTDGTIRGDGFTMRDATESEDTPKDYGPTKPIKTPHRADDDSNDLPEDYERLFSGYSWERKSEFTRTDLPTKHKTVRGRTITRHLTGARTLRRCKSADDEKKAWALYRNEKYEHATPSEKKAWALYLNEKIPVSAGEVIRDFPCAGVPLFKHQRPNAPAPGYLQNRRISGLQYVHNWDLQWRKDEKRKYDKKEDVVSHLLLSDEQRHEGQEALAQILALKMTNSTAWKHSVLTSSELKRLRLTVSQRACLHLNSLEPTYKIPKCRYRRVSLWNFEDPPVWEGPVNRKLVKVELRGNSRVQPWHGDVWPVLVSALFRIGFPPWERAIQARPDEIAHVARWNTGWPTRSWLVRQLPSGFYPAIYKKCSCWACRDTTLRKIPPVRVWLDERRNGQLVKRQQVRDRHICSETDPDWMFDSCSYVARETYHVIGATQPRTAADVSRAKGATFRRLFNNDVSFKLHCEMEIVRLAQHAAAKANGYRPSNAVADREDPRLKADPRLKELLRNSISGPHVTIQDDIRERVERAYRRIPLREETAEPESREWVETLCGMTHLWSLLVARRGRPHR